VIMQTHGWFAKEWERAKGTLEYEAESLNLSISERILAVLEDRGMSRRDLAEKLGISVRTLDRWLDEASRLTMERLLRIARALGCGVEVEIRDAR